MVSARPPVSTELETLLSLIAEAVQLPLTLHQKAQERYRTLTELLSNSSLAEFSIDVYPQGSYRIGTTVRPLSGEEYDLDFVVEIVPIQPIAPDELLDAVWEVLKNSGRHAGMIERLPSCIRIIYADEFHMDIVPARSKPENGPTAIEIPRVTNGSVEWHPTDPKAFAAWFENVSSWRTLAKEMKVEPLPRPIPADEKSPTLTATQLYKRNHHVRVDDEHLRTASIVLTTLIADSAGGTKTLGDAIERLIDALPSVAGQSTPPKIANPGAPYETISDKWSADPRIYEAFSEHSRRLTRDWTELLSLQGRGVDVVAKKLEDMFGVAPVNSAVKAMAVRTRNAASTGRLTAGAGGVLSVGETMRPNPRKTFYGGKPE